jgi:hypothetical protein
MRVFENEELRRMAGLKQEVINSKIQNVNGNSY